MFHFNFGAPPPQIQPEQIHQQRIGACKFCLHRNVIMNTCNPAEKIISIYAKNLNNKCPVGRWP
ncbi:hypothetical protein EBU95_15830 [bacterium]|nr:hypothetical protein [bacterium]